MTKSEDNTSAAPRPSESRVSYKPALDAGGYLGVMMGVGILVLAVWLATIEKRPPMPLIFGLAAIGIVESWTGWLLGGSRAAWAFACSLNGTLATVFLFGAPKLRDAADVNLEVALLPSVVFAVLTTWFAITGWHTFSRKD